MPECRRKGGTAATCAALVMSLAIPTAAHDAHNAGPYRLVIGWGDEPAFTGIRNAVVVEITEMGKGPVSDLGGGSLVAEVSFGAERVVLALEPQPRRPGVFQAWIVPTRAGTYTLHVTGKVKNQAIDVTTTCSARTFDCVVEGSEIQFPVKDPSVGQVAERLNRFLPRAEQAVESAARAQTVALAAIVIAGFGVISAIVLSLRRGRKGG